MQTRAGTKNRTMHTVRYRKSAQGRHGIIHQFDNIGPELTKFQHVRIYYINRTIRCKRLDNPPYALTNRAVMEYRCRTLALVSDAVGYEIRLFWAFSWRDWSMTIIPGTIRTISALRSLDSASTGLVVESIAHSLAYFALFVYAFNLANQITGVDEDRINKPDRPLPSGLVTVHGAYIRWYAITLFHLAISAAWGVLPWTIPWVLIDIHVNFYGGDKHWFTKNQVCLSVGSFCQLQAAWGLVAPITLHETRWAGTLSCVLGIVMNLQDLRDVEGDRIAERQTLPIVLGDSFRWVMAVIICAAPFVCWVSDFLVGYCGFGLAVSMFYVAYRVVSGDSREYDHRTYMIFTYIYCGCISVPGIFPMFGRRLKLNLNSRRWGGKERSPPKLTLVIPAEADALERNRSSVDASRIAPRPWVWRRRTFFTHDSTLLRTAAHALLQLHAHAHIPSAYPRRVRHTDPRLVRILRFPRDVASLRASTNVTIEPTPQIESSSASRCLISPNPGACGAIPTAVASTYVQWHYSLPGAWNRLLLAHTSHPCDDVPRPARASSHDHDLQQFDLATT
ncbi:UbiA prenyltransferase [Mycena sanguinolenta]|uniref:UbiA prenyltransferase n=1 Tax=Mycena sanguinolenta TaxID=230812 RepID=A0A8H7DNB6_9AGAR|nr:UbiA prenyltransferase [Mycena sanguinolenta]